MIGSSKVNIYFQYIYIEGDLGIVILISKFPNLCHDMKTYPIVQLSYLQCPGDIIISDFGKNEKDLISCNKINSVKLYLSN